MATRGGLKVAEYKKQLNFSSEKLDRLECEPGKKQTLYSDSTTKGLRLRVTGNSRTFVFEAKLGAKTMRIGIGDVSTWSVSAARQCAREYASKVDRGIDPRLEKQELIRAAAEKEAAAIEEARLRAEKERIEAETVESAWQTYLAHHKKRWGERHYRDHINLSQPGGVAEGKKRARVQGVIYPLLQVRMIDVNAELLTDWISRESETRANNARQGFELFRAFWRWCAARKEYSSLVDLTAVENSDLRKDVPQRKTKKSDVFQRAHLPDWFSAVRGLSNPVASAYLQALLLTGARREEMGQLRWADVDFKWSALWVKDKVEADGRHIPLTPYLKSLLSALPRRNEWVFSSPAGKSGRLVEPRLAHNRALSLVGLPHVSLHGLRRTFASLAEWVEMPKGIVAQIMGHKPNATAERHYIDRPLELLAVWHNKYESWILEQARVDFTENQSGLRLVGGVDHG